MAVLKSFDRNEIWLLLAALATVSIFSISILSMCLKFQAGKVVYLPHTVCLSELLSRIADCPSCEAVQAVWGTGEQVIAHVPFCKHAGTACLWSAFKQQSAHNQSLSISLTPFTPLSPAVINIWFIFCTNHLDQLQNMFEAYYKIHEQMGFWNQLQYVLLRQYCASLDKHLFFTLFFLPSMFIWWVFSKRKHLRLLNITFPKQKCQKSIIVKVKKGIILRNRNTKQNKKKNAGC